MKTKQRKPTPADEVDVILDVCRLLGVRLRIVDGHVAAKGDEAREYPELVQRIIGYEKLIVKELTRRERDQDERTF